MTSSAVATSETAPLASKEERRLSFRDRVLGGASSSSSLSSSTTNNNPMPPPLLGKTASSSSAPNHHHQEHHHPFRYITDLFDTATPALCSGAIQAVLFNPFDRALYVRVQQKRKRFLDRRNFESPFQGFANAAVYRTISSASYIFWQDTCRYFINELGGGEGVNTFTPANYPLLYSATTGIVAGAANGLALNNMQAVKFTMWSQSSQVVSHWETSKDAAVNQRRKEMKMEAFMEKNHQSSSSSKGGASSAKTKLTASSSTIASSSVSAVPSSSSKGFFTTAREMYAIGGPKVFFRGVKVTILRDTVFGLVYEVMRKSTSIRGGLQATAHELDTVRAVLKGDAQLIMLAGGGAKGKSLRTDHRRQWKAEENKRFERRGDQNSLAFVQNVLAACCGCAVSSPFNYLRSLSYGSPLGATTLPLKTLYNFYLREVMYVFHHGHSFIDAVKGQPHSSLNFFEMNRVEDARRRLGFKSLYSSGKGKAMADEASKTIVSSFCRRINRYTTPLFHSGAHPLLYAYYPQKKRHFYAAAVHLNRRLNIGWGSLRVGLGMAVGQHVFAMVREAMNVK